MKRAIVAIVGRPNVGKSTLFNRLLGQRAAIIEDEPGTTRDRLYGDIEWNDRQLSIVDTGGLERSAEGDIERKVQDQARQAIAEADAIIFLVDAQAGVTMADEEAADLLRRQKKPVILAANKAENRTRELNAVEFYALGLDEPVLLSAHHGTGIYDLMDAVAAALPPDTSIATEPSEEAQRVRIAVVGRPNVGKSMLVNAILRQERVLVSAVPGTTRDSIDTQFRYNETDMTLIDTAGVRRSGRIEVGVEKYSVMRAMRAIQRADVAVLVIDADEGITSQDTHVAGYVHEAYKGMVAAVNKWDLAKEASADRGEFALEVAQRLKFWPDAPAVFTSAKLRQGISQLLNAVMTVHKNRLQRVTTAEVNQCIQRALQAHPPPTVKGRRLKILYVTQADVAPPTFVFFVNDASLIHFTYQRYLENRLREAFGFQGTPIRMTFKSRNEE